MALPLPPKWLWYLIGELFLYLLLSVIVAGLYHIVYLNFLKGINYFDKYYWGIQFYIIILLSIVLQSQPPIESVDERINYWARDLFHSKLGTELLRVGIWLVILYLICVHYFFSDPVFFYEAPSLKEWAIGGYIKLFIFYILYYYFTCICYKLLFPLYVFSYKYIWRGRLGSNPPRPSQIWKDF